MVKPEWGRKTFGMGPLGAMISLGLFFVFLWLEKKLGLSRISGDPGQLRWIGGMFIAAGLGLHLWSFLTLRNWWRGDALCTGGPFQYFRHPMYAAWITFAAPGLALWLNSYALLVWAVLLHPLWHTLVGREENLMIGLFGQNYSSYAAKTGRFIPRLFRR